MTDLNNGVTIENSDAVLVTGASSGIGLAICQMLVEEGYTVYGMARSFQKCSFAHEHFHQCEVDLSDSRLISTRMSEILGSVQGSIKALVNNVGIGKMGYLEQLSADDIRSTVDVNFLSHVLVTKAVLPTMKQESGTKDIVFIGSEAALQGAQQGSIYCATKFALRGFAQSLRQECAKSSVRVSLVNPGAVRSNFFDELNFEPGESQENAIEPVDVAQVVNEILSMRGGTVMDEINLSPLKRVWQSKKS